MENMSAHGMLRGAFSRFPSRGAFGGLILRNIVLVVLGSILSSPCVAKVPYQIYRVGGFLLCLLQIGVEPQREPCKDFWALSSRVSLGEGERRET